MMKDFAVIDREGCEDLSLTRPLVDWRLLNGSGLGNIQVRLSKALDKHILLMDFIFEVEDGLQFAEGFRDLLIGRPRSKTVLF